MEGEFKIFGTSWLLDEFPLLNAEHVEATPPTNLWQAIMRPDAEMVEWMNHYVFPLDTAQQRGRCTQVLYILQSMTQHLVVVPRREQAVGVVLAE